MKKRILPILLMFVLWVPAMIYAEDEMRGEVLPTPANVESEESPILFPKEWWILEKIPTGKRLATKVWLLQEGMTIDYIQSVFGKPQEIVTVILEGQDGTILVYPHHYFFFSDTGYLQTIEERKVQPASTVK